MRIFRNIFFIFIFSRIVSTIDAQTFLIEEEFNSGTTAPGGWTFTAIGGTYAGSANFGKSSPALQIDNTGDRILTPAWVGTADQVTFYVRAINSPNASDNLLIEGWNGSSWTTVGNAKPYTTSRIFTFSLASNISQLRLTYTKGATNIAFDDLTIRAAGNCIAPMKITSLMIDACDAGSSCEGRNEYVTFSNSNVPLNLNDFEISYPDVGTSGGCTYCGTVANAPCDNTIVTNSTYTANLNSTATPCNPFLDPPGGIIPANANVIIFSGNGPNFTYDFSSLCASGVTYYAIYANNTSDCNGRFGNSGSCPNCYRDVFIRNRATGCTDTTYYNQSLLNSSNGSFTSISNGVVTYNTSGCNNFIVLPVELTSFTATSKNNSVSLEWSTASELNNNFFTIERAGDDGNFNSIGTVNGNGTCSQAHSYSFVDHQPLQGNNYYRLRQTDFNGVFTYYNPVAVNYSVPAEHTVTTWNCESGICYSLTGWDETVLLQIYDMTGNLISTQQLKGEETGIISSENFRSGIYFLKFSSEKYQEVRKNFL